MKYLLTFFMFSGFALAISGIIAAFYSVLSSIKLHARLHQRNDNEKINYLSSIGAIGPGINNPFRTWEYLNSEEDNDDENILKAKKGTKKAFKYFITLLLVASCCFLIVFLLTYLGKNGFIEMKGVTFIP